MRFARRPLLALLGLAVGIGLGLILTECLEVTVTLLLVVLIPTVSIPTSQQLYLCW
jgi:hypothetical protein